MKPEPTITLETAHDVRQLCSCANCGGMGDRRHMPKVNGRYIHGFCAVDTLGIEGVCKLPRKEVGKITLGEIGAKKMKLICDRLAGE